MHWRRKWQPTPVFLPGESNGWSSLVGCSPWGRTESDTTEVTWQHSKGYLLLWGKLQKNNLYQITQFKGKGSGTPLQYSWLENPMDGGAWWAAVHGVAKSRIQLSDFIFTFHFHALEKEMATHSSVLAWRIPGRGEPGGLPSLGLHRVRHD